MKPTWAELVNLQPKLLELESYAIEHRTGNFRKACKLWYGRGGLKKRMSALVGWFTPEDTPELLRGGRAYETCYHHLFDILSTSGKGIIKANKEKARLVAGPSPKVRYHIAGRKGSV